MATCLIGVGANLGDRTEAAGFAADQLQRHQRVGSLRSSRYFTTKPIGGPEDQAEFLNAVFRIETSLAPTEVLQLLQDIEDAAGRRRSQRWAARRLDLDLLLYGETIVEQEGLVIPHPRMTFRRFVLEPAAEVAGELLHPTTGRRLTDLRQRLDRLPHYIAVSDGARVKQSSLLRDVAAEAGAVLLLGPSSPDSDVTDSPSLEPAPAIEFLEQLLQTVKGIESTGEAHSWLSDFWLGDVLLAARRSMAPSVYGAFEEAWRQREPRVPEPMLVVLFDADEDAICTARDFGLPTLKLDSADPDWNRQEVAAAINAMK